MDAERPNPLASRIDEIRDSLKSLNPHRLAEHTMAVYQEGETGTGHFYLEYWGQPVTVTYPYFVGMNTTDGAELNTLDQAMLVYYFHESDGTPEAHQWIAFTELPSGQFYTQAFQGYTGREMVTEFGNNMDHFRKAALHCGGDLVDFGDLAFRFQVLPRVSLVVAAWLGDEDFPPSYRILFDASAGHHLTTDALAILGSVLTRKLLKAAL